MTSTHGRIEREEKHCAIHAGIAAYGEHGMRVSKAAAVKHRERESKESEAKMRRRGQASLPPLA
jgi:hypothetical protein